MEQEIEALLVEDSASDAELTIRALKQNNLANSFFHVKNGAEALDFIFSEGGFAGRPEQLKLKVILLDLNMTKVSGMEVLLKIKSDERTKKFR